MSGGATQGTKDFFQRQEGFGGTKFNFWAGLVMTVLGGLMLLTMPAGGIQLGAGVVLMLTARWAQNNPLARVHTDHVEVKAAVAAAKQLVLFSDVVELKEELPKKATLVTRDGKKLVLPLRALAPHDANTLMNAVRAKLGHVGATV